MSERLTKGVADFLEAKKSGKFKHMSTNQLVRNLRKEVVFSGQVDYNYPVVI